MVRVVGGGGGEDFADDAEECAALGRGEEEEGFVGEEQQADLVAVLAGAEAEDRGGLGGDLALAR